MLEFSCELMGFYDLLDFTCDLKEFVSLSGHSGDDRRQVNHSPCPRTPPPPTATRKLGEIGPDR